MTTRVSVTLLHDIKAAMAAEERRGRVAVRAGLDAAAQGLQRDWRGQVVSAGLGARLGNTIRSQTYPRQPSSNAAAMIWTRAPKVIDAFDRGALIRSKNGFFLAIPTEAAGTKGMGKDRITPGGWEQRTGIRLRFVYRPNGPSLLVADDARLNTRGRAMQNRRRARADGTRTGSMTVPIFILVPQVQLRKRLDIAPMAERWVSRAPGLIADNWPRG